jgi:hypothetical protein
MYGSVSGSGYGQVSVKVNRIHSVLVCNIFPYQSHIWEIIYRGLSRPTTYADFGIIEVCGERDSVINENTSIWF